MIGKVLFPLLGIPLVLFCFFGAASGYGWMRLSDLERQRTDQYHRLKLAETRLVRLKGIENALNDCQRQFDRVENGSVVENAKLFLAQSASPASGVKLDSSRAIDPPSLIPCYGALAVKYTCRSETIANYLSNAMNQFSTLAVPDWSIDVDPRTQVGSDPRLLEFNATILLLRLREEPPSSAGLPKPSLPHSP